MREVIDRLKGDKLSLVGLAILGLFILIAALAPLISPYDPWYRDTPMQSPGGAHLLGTNDVGQDILSEIIYGGRVSLFIVFFSTITATVIGLVVGLLSGYYEKLGFVLMRVVDVFLVIPRFPIIIIMAAFLRPGMWNLIALFVIFGWPVTARIIRSGVLTQKNREYVEGVKMLGASDPYILAHYIFPAILPLVLVQLIVEATHVILAESGLSFLGLGDPTAKSWGMILHYAFEYPSIFISDVWIRWMLPAGICITLTIFAFTFIGRSLEEWANPRIRRWAPARL